jgi:hypothetical protein
MSQWYVGEIIEFDDEDREYHISFMDDSKKSFRWPEKDHGRSFLNLTFNLKSTTEEDLITKLYDKHDDFTFPIVDFPCIISNIPAGYFVTVNQIAMTTV